MIEPIPPLAPGLKDAALRGTLIPFIGAGASRLAGCPNWTEFGEKALRYFIERGKLTHDQLAQLNQQPPRVKLSIARALQRKHNLPIDFDGILYPNGRNTSAEGRRLYEALAKLGTTFVTTNYDDWLDTTIGSPTLSVSSEADPTTPAIRQNPTIIYKFEELTPDNLERTNTISIFTALFAIRQAWFSQFKTMSGITRTIAEPKGRSERTGPSLF